MKELPKSVPPDVSGGYATPIPCTDPPLLPGMKPPLIEEPFPCPVDEKPVPNV
jgi:hypothetical protein